MRGALSGARVALVLQQRAEVVDAGERIRVPVAERRAPPPQRLAEQRLGGVVLALVLQQRAEVVDGAERVRVDIERNGIAGRGLYDAG